MKKKEKRKEPTTRYADARTKSKNEDKGEKELACGRLGGINAACRIWVYAGRMAKQDAANGKEKKERRGEE